MSKVVQREDGCWEWIGARTSDGYGSFSVNGRHGGMVNAHTAVYEHLCGPVPVGKELDHLCRRRWCVNPGHLEPVSHRVNVGRGKWHGKAKLTFALAEEIRKKATGARGEHRQLAIRYGVSRSLIGQILAKRIWNNNRDVLRELIEEMFGVEAA